VTLGHETTRLAARGGKATHLTVLVSSVTDPVDARIAADAVVGWVDGDHFEVLVGGVLVHPVGVQHTGVGAFPANAAFGDHLEGAWGLEVADTLVLGLTVHNTLGALHLASTTADGNTVDGVALLLLVAKLAGLVWAGGAVHLVDVGKLAVLPGTKAEEEPHHVSLLLLPYLFEVFADCGAYDCLKVGFASK